MIYNIVEVFYFMSKIINLKYQIKEDLDFIMGAEQKNIDELSKATGISRNTIYEILDTNSTTSSVYEKFYSYIYNVGYRINSVKEDLLKETNINKVLFHGSKNGLEEICSEGSRENCDFGKGFYVGETYEQALAFVCENKNSSVYSFACSFEGLNVLEFDCSLEWMLSICHYRRTLKDYDNSIKVQKLIEKIEAADVIIAPIADNRMFYIMTLFAEGEINADVALHSLSASKLGKQYIFKTEKSIEKISPIERYCLCQEEKNDCIKKLSQRTLEIETKLKLAKREFSNGLYIEELLK
jgi:hypothetical protein